MSGHRIDAAEVRRYPAVWLRYDDGLAGEIDLTPYLGRGPFFAPLADRETFAAVQVSVDGRSFGWHLDRLGEEIDFDADAARVEVETALVEARAERYRARHAVAAAAE